MDIGSEGVDWIHLDKDREKWQAVMNTVMALLGISCLDE
jgi:hypothetical protein